jgi:hypothetical protein
MRNLVFVMLIFLMAGVVFWRVSIIGARKYKKGILQKNPHVCNEIGIQICIDKLSPQAEKELLELMETIISLQYDDPNFSP